MSTITRTLANLFDNQQDLFNHIVKHLLTQGQQSKSNNVCAYRDADGVNACAVGACIPDEFYVPQMEGRGVWSMNQEFGIFPKEWIDVLDHCQSIHDATPPENWKVHLTKVAQVLGLRMPQEYT
jgi:hypothetical protein